MHVRQSIINVIVNNIVIVGIQFYLNFSFKLFFWVI